MKHRDFIELGIVSEVVEHQMIDEQLKEIQHLGLPIEWIAFVVAPKDLYYDSNKILGDVENNCYIKIVFRPMMF